MQKGNKKHRKRTRKTKPISFDDALATAMAEEIRKEIDAEIVEGLRCAIKNNSPVDIVVKMM